MQLSSRSALALTTLAALGLAAMPHAAQAQKIVVSGDVNIANPLDGSFDAPINPGNQAFFQNVLGSGTKVVQANGYSGGSAGDAEASIQNFYNSLSGVTATTTSGPITAATLAGADLFVDVLPLTAFSSSEVSALQDFSASGGTIFFLGDVGTFSQGLAADGFLNTALTSLGGGLQIVPGGIDGGFFHTISGPNIASDPLTAGVSSFSYGFTSQVTGGTGLFFTQTGNLPFVATANSAPVPETSTMVSMGLLLVLGLGGVAVTARRRTGKSTR